MNLKGMEIRGFAMEDTAQNRVEARRTVGRRRGFIHRTGQAGIGVDARLSQ